MPADNAEKYIVATFALWAGDLAYAELLFQEVSPTRVGSREESPTTPEALVRATASLRLRQIWQKKGEFKLLTEEEYDSPGKANISDKPLTIETPNLRGAVWRRDEREFLLLAFLTDLTAGDQMFARAREQANIGLHIPSRDLAEQRERLGVDWVVEGNPFLQVSLTDMGLIEATATWVRANLPIDASAIVQPFTKLLNALDRDGGDTFSIR